MEAMNQARIIIRDTLHYQSTTLHVTINDDWRTEPTVVGRGVRQGDLISPKLFTLALGYAFKELGWDAKCISTDGTFLSHLRFADDLVLISNDLHELSTMLNQLRDAQRE